jgi:hypothetical protein
MPRTTASEKPVDPDAPKKARRISVLERRLQNPFGEPSAPIALRDPSLVPRWFNSAGRPDNIWRAKEQGWTGITPGMILDITQIGTFTTSPDGYVARGERAQEVLMAMPKDDFAQIQMAKTKENIRRMGHPNAQRQEAVEAYGKVNPDGATLANRLGGPVGGVHDSYERIEQTEPTDE